MYDATEDVGRRSLMMHAIGGIDLALWDIAGQAAGKPVSELLEGRCRERVEAYGTIYPIARKKRRCAGYRGPLRVGARTNADFVGYPVIKSGDRWCSCAVVGSGEVRGRWRRTQRRIS